MKSKASSICDMLIVIGITIVIMNLINLSQYEKKAKMISEYSIYYADVISTFSIHSNSPIINSEKLEDSILIQYENKDILRIVFNVKHSDTKINFYYTSEKFLNANELITIIENIKGQTLSAKTIEQINNFCNTENNRMVIEETVVLTRNGSTLNIEFYG